MPASIEVEQRIKEIIAKHFKRSVATLDGETRLREDLGADSLDLLEVVFALEKEVGVTIDEAEVPEIRTIGDALRYVERLRL